MTDGSTRWPATRPTLMLGVRDIRNEVAWTTFVDVYLPIVLSYCRSRGLQDADARDVTQIVIVRVRKFIHRYDPGKGRFRGWLAKTTRNEINRHSKRWEKGRGQGGLDGVLTDDDFDTPQAGPDLDWDRIYNAHLLESALARIHPEFNNTEWTAFEAVAYRVEDTSQGKFLVNVSDPDYARAAANLDQPVGWVYKVKSRIMKRLKQEILYLADELGLFL